MIKRTIAIRYAKALFDLDRKKEDIEIQLLNFKSLMQLFDDHPDKLKYLQTPHIKLDDKKKLLQNSLSKEVSPLFFNFLIYLIEKRRLKEIRQIDKEFRLLVNEYLGIWDAKITTAVPLEPDIEEKLKQKLENFYHFKIKVSKEVDPSIIGGAILVVGNEMIDWSLSSRLKKMKEKLLTTSV